MLKHYFFLQKFQKDTLLKDIALINEICLYEEIYSLSEMPYLLKCFLMN